MSVLLESVLAPALPCTCPPSLAPAIPQPCHPSLAPAPASTRSPLWQFYYLGLFNKAPKKLLRVYVGLDKSPWSPADFGRLVGDLRAGLRPGLAGALELMDPSGEAASGAWRHLLRQVCRDYPVIALLRPEFVDGEDEEATPLMAAVNGLGSSPVEHLLTLQQAFPALEKLVSEQKWQEIPQPVRGCILELQKFARAARSVAVHAPEMADGDADPDHLFVHTGPALQPFRHHATS